MASDVAIEALYNRLELPNRVVPDAMRLGDVISDLNADRPVQVFWSGEFGGHTVLIVGWQQDDEGRLFFDVHDPDPAVGQVQATFEDILSANGTGEWSFSWRFV
jgi:hypothetical protein